LQYLGSDDDSAISSSNSGITLVERDQILTWEDFAGYENEKKAIQNIISRVNNTIGDIENISSLRCAVEKPRGTVLWGPSGCGKSYIAKIIAAEANMNFINVRSTALLSKYFGQTEAKLRSLFRKARAAAPCILFFDEFDSIASNR
jgi:SpoVK/Ycf46/Vps4 family AAA+-type ATPase